MATYAVIGRATALTRLQGQAAALVCVAGETLAVEIGWRFLTGRLYMRIMAGNAAQTAASRPIALTQSHRIVLLKVIFLWRRFARWGNHQDREGIVQRSSRLEALERLTQF